MMLGKVSHGACSERSPLGSFAQLAHSPRIQPADGHYHSTNYLQRERAKKDGAEQEWVCVCHCVWREPYQTVTV